MLTFDEKIILGYGLSFSHKDTDLSDVNLFTSVIKSSQNNTESMAFLSGCILSSLYKTNSNNDVIPNRLSQAIVKLKKKKSITRSDKTNQIVILDKTTYNEKVYSLLEDSTTYKKNFKPTFKKG